MGEGVGRSALLLGALPARPQARGDGVIYWFRTDLRVGDNLALAAASASAARLLPVYCHDPAADTPTRWGFTRRGAHRRTFLNAALTDLDAALRARGSRLLQVRGAAADVLPALARALGTDRVACEAIAAPEEVDELASLRAAGLQVRAVWQSTMLDPGLLPFEVEVLPKVFTDFRRAVEMAGVLPAAPLAPLAALPPCPSLDQLPGMVQVGGGPCQALRPERGYEGCGEAAFPWWRPEFAGGERAALAHLASYFASARPRHYKVTRNGLSGVDFSSKFSPWLAQGALSPRVVFAALRRHEAEQGASDGSYWLWFELLWRDYFRFLHLQHGRRLYRARGLDDGASPPAHDPAAFEAWCAGRTGQAFVDAGMRELAATGWLSNRMRQVVASYLIHDLGCDWRAGAAWFEAQLVDYDTYSNQGNWLYIAGRGTDPRGGRRFDPDRQAARYDADGDYRARWLGAHRHAGSSA